MLATVGLTACSGSIYTAKVGDCLTEGFSSKSVRIVPCSDATAKYRVSQILDGEERGRECPNDDGSILTRYWSVSDKTICVLEK
jgi:hypothetical protein